MKKRIVLICLLILCGGCGYWESIHHAKVNRNNLNKLQIGMTKERVREIAGNPYQIKAETNKEIWLYSTQIRRVPLGAGNWAIEPITTPLLFEDNKLVSWGQGIAEDEEEVDKYEIRMR